MPDVPPGLAGDKTHRMPGVPSGLTCDEARRRLAKDGPNAIVDVARHPVLRALQKLWAPVPWMLEAAIRFCP
jgi:H+-transporting ATPase